MDTEPERSTEKLVDLVFMLATKLDLNVNDMRSLLNNNAKQNIERFTDIDNKQEEDVELLNKKLAKLKEENKNQSENIAKLSSHHENTLLMHNKLQGKIHCEIYNFF